MLNDPPQTTFFAAMESQLLGTTAPDDPHDEPWPSQVANAALTGALVVHIFAAILAFFSAFFLIRYKLAVAKREERRVKNSAQEPDLEAGHKSREAGAPGSQSRGSEESGSTRRTCTVSSRAWRSALTSSRTAVWSKRYRHRLEPRAASDRIAWS